MNLKLNAAIWLLAALLPGLAWAGYGGMANVEHDDGVASFGIWTLIAIVVFFGGIAWYFMRAEDENVAFGKLAFAVIALIAGSSLYSCVS